MSQQASSQSVNERGPDLWARVRAYPVAVLCVMGTLIMFGAYLLVFATTMTSSFESDLISSFANSLPLGIMAYGTIHLLRERVIDRSVGQQSIAHIIGAPLFGLLWYVVVIVILGWSRGSLADGFSVSPFRGAAFAWQTFQGLTIYAAVAATAYALHYRETMQQVLAQARDASTATPSVCDSLILRDGDELHTVDIDEIIYIAAAGDYAEVTTPRGTHLSRKALGELEALLPAGKFVRVHRSRIVRLEAIIQAEPAGGGRMTLQMTGGHSVEASRAGAKLIRERSI